VGDQDGVQESMTESNLISNMKILYKNKILYMVNEQRISQEKEVQWVQVGNKQMQVETHQGKMYMNSEHMVAGSEENKRQDLL